MQSTALTMFRMDKGRPGLSAFHKEEHAFLPLLPDTSPNVVAREFKVRLGFDLPPPLCSRWADRRRVLHECAIGPFIGSAQGLEREGVQVGRLLLCYFGFAPKRLLCSPHSFLPRRLHSS